MVTFMLSPVRLRRGEARNAQPSGAKHTKQAPDRGSAKILGLRPGEFRAGAPVRAGPRENAEHSAGADHAHVGARELRPARSQVRARDTSCVGFTNMSAISSQTSVTTMYTIAIASIDCGARTPAANTA